VNVLKCILVQNVGFFKYKKGVWNRINLARSDEAKYNLPQAATKYGIHFNLQIM
jgi:hypothetical protein